MPTNDKDSEFLKEAIADARTIKEVAVQNAKDVLEEAFTTRLQSMISDRIQREAEEEMGYDMDDMESDYEDEMETTSDVSGSAEVETDPDDGDLEGLELDLDFDEPEEEEFEEPSDDEEEDLEDMGGDYEEEPEEAPTGDEEGEDEDDIDLEEVLRFLEGETEMDYNEEQDTGPDEYRDDDMDEMEHDYMDEGSYRDSDIQEIINDLEEDVDREDNLDQQIESFLESLDDQVYEVDLNELQEQVSRSSESHDDVLEIDIDKLEEEFQKPEYRRGTEGHDMGDYYDGDGVLDGFGPVSQGDIGHHGEDSPAPGTEEDLDMPDPSTPDLGDPISDEGYYDDSSFDGYDKVGRDDVRNHGPDDPAPGFEQDLGESFDYSDLLSELEIDGGGRSRSSDSRNNQKVEQLREENNELQEKLNKHRQAVKILRKRINEVNLINSKLLYTNRLFKRYNLNESQKLRVIEALDRATDKRGAKLVYSTLSEAFDSNVMRKGGNGSSSSSSSSNDKRSLAEAVAKGMGSKKKGTQKPKNPESKQKILNENVGMKDRMQKLADING